MHGAKPIAEKIARPHPRDLSVQETQAVLEMVDSSPQFIDSTPAAAYAALLDEGKYLCSLSTMHRSLRAHEASRERRAQRRHGCYEVPQLIAKRPNEAWSWDIAKLYSMEKFECFYLYVMLDVFSRKTVRAMLTERESGTLAAKFIRDCVAREEIEPNTLAIHSDRGSPMMSKPVVSLLSTLDVQKTVLRPHVSSDIAFSAAQFKAMKYWPCFLKRFGSIQND